MRARSVWVSVLCAFIVGILAGIWLDMSVSQQRIADRHLVFEVQPYQMANLQVHPGDTLSLAIPRGGTGSAAINWIGNNPCVNGGSGASCTIGSTVATGPYFFNCASQNYSCPEPGVQQGPAPPGLKTSYGEMVVKDFAHLFGISGHHYAHPPQPPTPTTGGPGPADNSITAIASCTGGVAKLQDPNGNDLTLITAPVGETVYWIDPNRFSVNLSSAPAGLCAGVNPGTGIVTDAKCPIALAKQDVHYTITPVGSPACSPLAAELKTIANQPAPGGSH